MLAHGVEPLDSHYAKVAFDDYLGSKDVGVEVEVTVEVDTLSWDDVEDRIMQSLHTTVGESLAEIHNTICDTRPKIAYDGDSQFKVAK